MSIKPGIVGAGRCGVGRFDGCRTAEFTGIEMHEHARNALGSVRRDGTGLSPGRASCLRSTVIFLLLAALTAVYAVNPLYAMKSDTEDDPSTVQMPQCEDLISEPAGISKDDFPEMQKRGVVRVLVEYSRTDFFVVAGELLGFEYELLKNYERFLNDGHHREAGGVRVVFVPMPFDQLIPALLAGKGDIAAASITITPEREKLVNFSTPYVDDVGEVLVASAAVEMPRDLDGLSGKSVAVLKGSSHEEHLNELNAGFAREGRPEIQVIEAPSEFTAEDLLEVVGANIFSYVIVDSHTADIWSKVLPNIRVNPDIRISSGNRIAWAVRKENPELLASINNYFATDKSATLNVARKLISKYYGNTRWVIDPKGNNYSAKLKRYAAYFRDISKPYHFDWLMIAALAFHESRFNESLVSPTGAVGIMQVLPTTAKGLGFRNVKPAKENIQAGIRYMDLLRANAFMDSAIPESERIYFVLAAYNAGPNRVNRVRAIAQQMGLNPNVWFGNVEYAAMQAIGDETLNYVANISKYYTAYKLAWDLSERRDNSRLKVLKSGICPTDAGAAPAPAGSRGNR